MAVLLVGCSGESTPASDDVVASASPRQSQSPTPSPAPSPTQAAKPGTRIIADWSPFGTMLYDARGQAIYLFDREAGRPQPRCYGECATEWPPVLTDGPAVPGKGVRGELLGTAERRDGATQVTYNGHPLYFYANEAPGEVLCHDFEEYGGIWYVVQPNGKRGAT
ncbi:hypothetical protein BH09ACT10_BH09ACT10_27790 [soil metagenome]